MTKRPIGFRSYQQQDKNEAQDKQQEQQERQQKAIADFLGQHYAPIGSTPAKCYKTSAELAYELANIIEVSPRVLAAQLTAAGYRVEYVAGQPYWVMYEK